MPPDSPRRDIASIQASDPFESMQQVNPNPSNLYSEVRVNPNQF